MGCDVLALGLVRDWEFVADSQVTAPAQDQEVGMMSPKIQLQRRKTFFDLEKEEDKANMPKAKVHQIEKKPAPTQFVEPSMDSLLDNFGF